MDDFIANSGKYVYFVIAALSFSLGLLSSILIEYIKTKKKKYSLIELFINNIQENWVYTSNLITAPDGSTRPNSGTLFHLKGISGLALTDYPEYNFEVYNVKLLES